MVSILIPELPNLNNYINAERRDRYLGAKVKRDATNLVAWTIRSLNIKKPVNKINKITCIWKQKNKRKDPDNISFAIKFILDGMQAAGLIENDGWKLWKGSPKIIHKFEIAEENEVLVMLK